ncbi:Inositol phospholipid synthesis and fat-storage-inducing TM [Geosmithia morbida]|uniref:Acyl-coenzyme A diphosphatase SCS3 n=1 Tax=Geosmithia morbida TaxID=1094350 RepID=A0A9P4YP93_9HYPO|nr:Inositol phospholipid synthesis and fat-storage-inducing TM [Geosmithia morbida]KAF4119302.1 Inositol phospholipid synthesis and fat-storage-inducing TM [Geosmithia morbida]
MAADPTRPHPTTSLTPPYLPTKAERIVLVAFPVILLFGSLFSVLSPTTRDAPYDHVAQAHVQDPAVAPSYFARKSNVFNVVFVKQGWAWTTAAVLLPVLTHPAMAATRVRVVARWAAVTAWWFFVTQWCFGAPLIDRGFLWTGGECEAVAEDIAEGSAGLGGMVTSVACKAAGGKWKGGHDISGHVFLLVLSTLMIVSEVGWAVLRYSGYAADTRAVVKADGSVEAAEAEAVTPAGEGRGRTWLGVGGQFASAVVALNLWMVLMTAIYFHTWFEKFTGLLTAFVGFYVVYIVPRFVPSVRGVLGLPGI